MSITACGEHCVLATRADDSSGQVQYTLYGENFSGLVKVMQNSLVLLCLGQFLIGLKNSQHSLKQYKKFVSGQLTTTTNSSTSQQGPLANHDGDGNGNGNVVK